VITREESLLIVVSGPSGAGKTSLCAGLLRRHPSYRMSISATTRPPRGGEREGRDYFFLSPQEFEQRKARGYFLEWAVVHDHMYGTPSEFVEACRAEGHSVVFDIDVQGSMQIRKTHPDAVLVFVLPPSKEVLRRRLVSRKTDSPEVVETRMRNALAEVAYIDRFDYLIVNDRLERAEAELETLLRAERLRTGRSHWLSFLAEEEP